MTVTQCCQQWITEGVVYHQGGSGSPRNTNSCDDHAIIRVATSSPTTSMELVRCPLSLSRLLVVSRETIRRRLTDTGDLQRRIEKLSAVFESNQTVLNFYARTYDATRWYCIKDVAEFNRQTQRGDSKQHADDKSP
ncbi:hypothetical protein TNCV_1644641 [Trichonephila clavipes]|nr:hypothetical protein TNCV_1644641 [Trichonephila clavipes]